MTNKGEAIRFQMERGLSNAQISKTLGIPESTIRYYRKRPKNLEVKRNSKLPTKYINKICELASNKTTREMSGRFILIKINKMLEIYKIICKKRKIINYN